MIKPAADRKVIDPVKLAIYILLAIGVVSALGVAANFNTDGKPNLFPYLIACSFTLLYALLNSILLINAKDIRRYWIRSMTGFAIILIGGIGFSYLLSGIHPIQASYYYQIYAVVTVGYFVFLAITGLIRRLLEWAQQ